MADFPGAQFLHTGRLAEECIELSFDEGFRKLVFFGDPFDVVDGIEPDIGGHQSNQHVLRRIEGQDANPLAPQIRDAVDAVVGDQFEASGVQPAKHLDWHASVDRCEMDRHIVHAEVRLAACDPHRLIDVLVTLHVADIGEAFSAEQLSGHIQARPSNKRRRSICGRRTEVVSGGSSAQAGVEVPIRPAAPTDAAPAKKWRRFWMICIGRSFPLKGLCVLACLRLQLPLQLVEETPICVCG